jgi:tetratricopeptide (TPR) repeat protein
MAAKHSKWLLALALSLASVPALAAAPPTTAQAEAEAQFRKGRAAMDKGDYAAALELLKWSHAAEPGRGKLLNIAICEAKLGMVATALSHFRELAPQFPADDDRTPIIAEYIQKLKARLPTLTIAVPAGAPAGLQVTLDGAAVETAMLGTNMPLDPGKHTVEATLPGGQTKQYDVDLAESERKTVSVELGSSSPTPPAEEPTPVERRRSIVPTLLLGGAGVAGLGVGVAFVVQREAKRLEAVQTQVSIRGEGQSCVSGASNFDAARCPALQAATADGDAFGTGALVGFIAGGLFVAGAVTYLLWPSAQDASTPAATITVFPAVSARQQGIVVSGTF